MEEHRKHQEYYKEHKEKSKHEIHRDSRHDKQNTKLWIMALVLGLLIVISGVQAVELVSLKNKLNEDLTTIAASSTNKKTISTGSGSGTLKNNLNNLPSMVGGC